MDKLKMQTTNVVDENIKKIGELFPNCLTEKLDENGRPQTAIDFDQLRQELSKDIVEGPEERYQFTWPDKRNAIRLANAPTTDTLRPCREESVDFDNTQNLYIEGDNLEVLKLLRQNYLGKVKMIYIDPPYNTGNDFVYNDDFAQSAGEYVHNSGQEDEEGNRLVANTESNGRFHTDWLNMIYPRLKVAKDLLSEDGAIFIHIDEHEVYSLQQICKEIFGAYNELGTIIWDKRNPKGSVVGVAYQHESIIVFCKSKIAFAKVLFAKDKENAPAMMAKAKELIKTYGGIVNDNVRANYKKWLKEREKELSGGEKAYSLIDNNGKIYQPVSMAAPDKPETRSHRPLIHPVTGKPCPVPSKGWRYKDDAMDALVQNGKIEFGKDENTQPRQKYYLEDNMLEAVSSLLYFGGSDDALGLPFENPKPVYVAKRVINTIETNQVNNNLVLDFFSGSATTAHAVMQLNAENGGNRKFIMVQLPEPTDEKSEAYKAGYKSICEIGKERIRRAGKKINEDCPLTAKDLDTGFRVLKLDSSNMNEVFYTPEAFTEHDLFEDNIKGDRTDEDLLFQTMIELGIELSAKIEKKSIAGKTIWSVSDGYLMACFDKDVNETSIKEIAKMKPFYFVMRDASMATDNVADNFEQIWSEYSKDTVRRVL